MLQKVQTEVPTDIKNDNNNNNNTKNNINNTKSECIINPITFDGIAETIVSKSHGHPFLWSARMTYTICAFLSMICQLCMRNTLNYVILFMVKENTTLELPQKSKNWSENGVVITNSTDIRNDNMQSIGEFNWSRSEVIFLQGTFYYGYVITLSIAGTLADRFGGKCIFVHSTTIQALIFLCMPFCARISYDLMVAMQILQGLVAGCNNPALYQLFSIWSHPSERTAALSFAYSGFSLGGLIIFPLSSFLCNLGNWDIVFYTVGGFSLILGLTFQSLVYSSLLEHPRLSKAEYEYLKPDKVSNQQMQRKVPWKNIMASCAMYAFVVTHIFHSYGILVLSLILPRYLSEVMSISLDKVGFFSCLPFLGTFLAQTLLNPFIGRMEKQIKVNFCIFRRVLYVLCSLLSIFVIVGIVTCQKSQELLLIFLMVGFGIATGIAFSAGYWPALLIMAPSYAGLLSGIATSLATCSGFLAPIAIKAFAVNGTKLEWNYVMLSIAVFYGLSAIIYGIFGRSKRQHWDNKNG